MAIEVLTRSLGYDLYKDDYESVDGVEDATFTKQDGSATVTGVKVKRKTRGHSQRSAGQSVGLETTESAFTIWDTTLDGEIPELADRLTVGSETWTLAGTINRVAWDTQWEVQGTSEVTTF
jgi:hypothetical protein